jgi:hypothetical protein
MRAALPKSLNGYLLLGIILIGVPLLAAIVRAALQMSQLHDFGSQLVRDSVQTTKALHELFRETDELNVEAQLYLIVGGDANRDKFNQQDRQLAATVSELRGLQSGETTWRALDSFTALQRDMVGRISSLAVSASAESRRTGQLATPFTSSLKDQYARVEATVEEQINAELGSLTNQTARAQRELALESSLLILLVLAVALSIALGIGRPLRQIDRAITELGGGNFARAISVSGPVDLASQPPAGAGAGPQPLPAAHVPRIEDATREYPRGHGAAHGRRRRRAWRRSARGGHHPSGQQYQAAAHDRKPAVLQCLAEQQHRTRPVRVSPSPAGQAGAGEPATHAGVAAG